MEKHLYTVFTDKQRVSWLCLRSDGSLVWDETKPCVPHSQFRPLYCTSARDLPRPLRYSMSISLYQSWTHCWGDWKLSKACILPCSEMCDKCHWSTTHAVRVGVSKLQVKKDQSHPSQKSAMTIVHATPFLNISTAYHPGVFSVAYKLHQMLDERAWRTLPCIPKASPIQEDRMGRTPCHMAPGCNASRWGKPAIMNTPLKIP